MVAECITVLVPSVITLKGKFMCTAAYTREEYRHSAILKASGSGNRKGGAFNSIGVVQKTRTHSFEIVRQRDLLGVAI